MSAEDKLLEVVEGIKSRLESIQVIEDERNRYRALSEQYCQDLQRALDEIASLQVRNMELEIVNEDNLKLLRKLSRASWLGAHTYLRREVKKYLTGEENDLI